MAGTGAASQGRGQGAGIVLQQRSQCFFTSMASFHPLQHPVPGQKRQVGLVLFPFLGAQNFNDLHEARVRACAHARTAVGVRPEGRSSLHLPPAQKQERSDFTEASSTVPLDHSQLVVIPTSLILSLPLRSPSSPT